MKLKKIKKAVAKLALGTFLGGVISGNFNTANAMFTLKQFSRTDFQQYFNDNYSGAHESIEQSICKHIEAIVELINKLCVKLSDQELVDMCNRILDLNDNVPKGILGSAHLILKAIYSKTPEEYVSKIIAKDGLMLQTSIDGYNVIADFRTDINGLLRRLIEYIN